MRWSGRVSRTYPASRPVSAGIGSTVAPLHSPSSTRGLQGPPGLQAHHQPAQAEATHPTRRALFICSKPPPPPPRPPTQTSGGPRPTTRNKAPHAGPAPSALSCRHQPGPPPLRPADQLHLPSVAATTTASRSLQPVPRTHSICPKSSPPPPTRPSSQSRGPTLKRPLPRTGCSRLRRRALRAPGTPPGASGTLARQPELPLGSSCTLNMRVE